MSAQSLMPQTCTITPYTQTRQGSGAWLATAGTPVANVPCNIQRLSAADAYVYGRELSQETFICFLPEFVAGAALTVNQKSKLVEGSDTYRVVGVAGKRVPQARHQELLLEFDTT